ncbi:MAG: hypothetical protein KAW52_00485 [candidate division Zixibacteria bacterium]|nr:hypothetical protein [candidate division Zixibacteria bacterium]
MAIINKKITSSDDHKKHVEANIKMEKKLKLEPPDEVIKGITGIGKANEIPKGIDREVTFAKKPRLPKKLIILSVEWDIFYHNNSFEVDLYKQGKYWGQTDFDTNKIRILKAGRKTEAIWCTLFHEILHILFHHLDIDDILGTREENVAVALSSALNDFFWRNFSAR